MAHGDVAVVAAEEDLPALGDDAAIAVDAGVDRRLAAAGAHGLDLRDGIGQLHEPPRAGEEVREKIRPQAEAQHRDVLLVNDAAQLVNLLGGEKLRLVRDDDIGVARTGKRGDDVLVRMNDLRLALQADARADDVRPVAVVDRRLDEPDRHAQLLIVELRDERLRGLRRAHGAVFKIEFGHLIPLLYIGPDTLHDKIERNLIMPAFGDNNIGIALRRLDEHLVHGLDRGQILRDDRLQVAAAVAHVAHDAPQDAHIGVRIDKELDVQPLAQLRLGKDEDALDDDDLGRADRGRLGRAVVHRVVVDRAFHRLPGAQRVEMLHEQLRVERIRVVVVELFALGEGNVVVPLVIIVVVQHAHIAAEFVENAPRDGGLAAAGAAGDADGDDVAHGAASRVSLFSPTFYHRRRAVAI